MTRSLVFVGAFLTPATMVSSAAAQAVAPSPAPSAYSAPASPPPAVVSSDESADSGLGLEWIWLNADLGVASTSMDSFDSSNLSLKKTNSAGPVFGIGGGLRLLFFTAGVRARDLQLADFSLWEVNAEAAFHIRIDHVDPYFGARGGYAFVGSWSSDAAAGSSTDVSVHGANVGLMFGLDYYFNHLISLGAEVNPEFLFLQRPPAALPAGLTQAQRDMISQQPLYKESGSSVGFGIAGTAHVGLHF